MNEIAVHLKNGEWFTFSTNADIKEINNRLNKNEFIYIGPMSFNKSEILYVRQEESR
jgi:hypothetical protein